VVARVAVLLSGRGSNLLALHGAMARGEVPADIVLVLSNEPGAPGLARARELGLTALAIPHRGAGGREAHERRVLAALAEAQAEWICLAGYMRLLSPAFIAAYPRRILNIHPSLLPAFPGLEAQRRALEHGVRVAGCTVHLVDEGLDSGPIVEQRAVPVGDGDTPASLAARILEQEHQAYPAALGRLLAEPWRLEGRRVVFERRAEAQG
jgi:phosphoribosylglycinamide formyltransferase-1